MFPRKKKSIAAERMNFIILSWLYLKQMNLLNIRFARKIFAVKSKNVFSYVSEKSKTA